ncbi:50S ribosomal protein L21 [candidate division WWE3 bacterium CG06_land_8_20_14_3_00_42_16]|uniref:Large ribosomal subunit protein bL21 n=4 Tax=Katanobacteria TaxID=422282 RepID=A0A2M7AMX4_UNCKA|nr:MAG: 50S ribosomal protein L21 [bacterium CG1_02_42_9]PIU68725.1 MAG: 50S ribosomal protein L21 [candidate division WWE3 bacterium CG06_land_8_20_14_3_00_42_16]PIZ41735.1 MAG: 50S ribosomal protein L21 [candidate division WWE3 bacterium CG_4_10_14_0_2_um_filter_42_8]PJA37389.1 MAG: 50S ribosomal protein L21 [candidate division WWE3 bacterium CG_4_9_14_3_um_filter_43_9]PJC68468.1 MAG: 50S ribosomal protein L21 [candidate division WWE3 bacterium CG_4_8_14_3_um_filter_42_11]
MKQAVIKIGGSQLLVEEGKLYTIDRIQGRKDEKIKIDQVLAFISADEVKIGKPVLKGISLEGVVVDQIQGEKKMIYKYRAKSRYRRKSGYRSLKTKIKINKIQEE